MLNKFFNCFFTKMKKDDNNHCLTIIECNRENTNKKENNYITANMRRDLLQRELRIKWGVGCKKFSNLN